MWASQTSSSDAPVVASASNTRIVPTTILGANHGRVRVWESRYATGAKAKGGTHPHPLLSGDHRRQRSTVIPAQSTHQERELSCNMISIIMIIRDQLLGKIMIIRTRYRRTTLGPLLGFLPRAPMVIVATSFLRMSCVETRSMITATSFLKL